MDVLRHLLYFSTVAEQRHVGRAAAQLTMAQPPLSQAIARLERHLGVRLFDRGPRGMRLTDAGRALLPRARALLEDEAGLRRAAAGFAEAARTVRIGAVPAIGPRAASDLTAAAAAANDGGADLVVGNARELIDKVWAGELALAVITHPAVLDGLDAGPVVERPVQILLPDEHPAARHAGPVAIDSLDGLAPVLDPRSHQTVVHDALIDVLDLRGCTAAPIEATSPAAGLAAVATGRGFILTCDPDTAAAGVARRPLAGEEIPVRLRLVWRPPGPPQPVRAAVQHSLESPNTKALGHA